MEHAADPGSWQFGWEALVALGTIGLAFVTGYLAWTTRSVAIAARDEQSGQWRPVLVPRSVQVTPVSPRMVGYRIVAADEVDSDDQMISIELENIGTGPAMSTDGRCGTDGFSESGEPIPVGGVVHLGFKLPNAVSWPLTIKCRDLGGRSHETTATITNPTESFCPAGITDVEVRPL